MESESSKLLEYTNKQKIGYILVILLILISVQKYYYYGTMKKKPKKKNDQLAPCQKPIK